MMSSNANDSEHMRNLVNHGQRDIDVVLSEVEEDGDERERLSLMAKPFGLIA